MPSGFLLVQTLPGREREVLDRLSAMPAVTARAHLFGQAIAVRIETPGAPLEGAVAGFASLEGVAKARLYRARAP